MTAMDLSKSEELKNELISAIMELSLEERAEFLQMIKSGGILHGRTG